MTKKALIIAAIVVGCAAIGSFHGGRYYERTVHPKPNVENMPIEPLPDAEAIFDMNKNSRIIK